MKGVHDPKGELFAYLVGSTLYSLDDEVTGRLEGDYIVDTAGNRVWRVVGDALYTLDGSESIGYFGSDTPDPS